MTNYNLSGGFTDTHDNQKWFSEKLSGSDIGPYIGIVKNTTDPLRMGRLGVLIPDLANVPETSRDPNKIIWCQYLSPFYGVKPLESVSKTDPYSHQTSQSSYGLWAVPPDIGTNVLVLFAKGAKGQKSAFWIGCVQEPLTNHMVPGNASSINSAVGVETVGEFGVARGGMSAKEAEFGTNLLPVGEKNRHIADGPAFDKWKYPINVDLAGQLMTQGLVQDPIRGTTSSSARRETPSRVFGISTPGRIQTNSRKPNIGLEGTPVAVDRNIGHSFVMDDGAEDGSNQLTRLRTASGHQLLMNDTAGVVYIANGSGNAYIEMSKDGRIDVYSGVGGINLRTEGDFNVHSDSNINFHAGGNIRMNSEKETLMSSKMLLTMGVEGVFTSSQDGPVMTYGDKGITSYTPAQQLHGAGGPIHLAGSQVHMNSVGASNSWGPNWLTKEYVGMEAREEGDVELTQKGIRPLQPFTRETKTTVHRLVTHEPMFRASVILGDGVIPIDHDDKIQWSKLVNTPGTAEYINNQNRLSTNSSIRDAQYQADALAYIQSRMGTSTNVQKAKKYLTDFGLKYNEIYGITSKIKLPFNIKDSISEKLKLGSISTMPDNLTKTLSSQVIESLSNENIKLFKDHVFVNSTGELFSLGTVSGITGNVSIENIKSTIGSLTNIQSTIGNLTNIKSTIGNLNSITQTFSNVIGGKIVGINQIKSLASKVGLFDARSAYLGGQTFLQNVTNNLPSVIGTAWGAVKTFFGRWSDIRLKEDVQLIGKSQTGINIYRFKYKHTNGIYEGVMAQEVPWARKMTDTGFYIVDYNKVDVDFRRLH